MATVIEAFIEARRDFERNPTSKAQEDFVDARFALADHVFLYTSGSLFFEAQKCIEILCDSDIKMMSIQDVPWPEIYGHFVSYYKFCERQGRSRKDMLALQEIGLKILCLC
jgi:hypothetical protein